MSGGYTLYEFNLFTPAEEIEAALEEVRAQEKTPEIMAQIDYLEKMLANIREFDDLSLSEDLRKEEAQA